jgi:hypothetical protein
VKESIVHQPTLHARSNSRRKLIGSSAAVLLVVVGLIAWRAWATRTPSPGDSPDKVRQFVASEDFKALPTAEKMQWVEAAEKGMQPDSDQQKMFRNLAQARMQKMLDDYFALPEGEARKDMLDKQIDEQEEIRKMIDSPSTQPGRIVVKRGGANAAAQKEMAETIPAEYQAKMAQYVKDMKDRRAERGLPTEGVPIGVMFKVQK